MSQAYGRVSAAGVAERNLQQFTAKTAPVRGAPAVRRGPGGGGQSSNSDCVSFKWVFVGAILIFQVFFLVVVFGWKNELQIQNDALAAARTSVTKQHLSEFVKLHRENHKKNWSPGVDWSKYENISIVYTWVNGSEPDYRELRKNVGGADKVGGSRDRDNQELRYSFRSLEMFLPWHKGMIYIVSPGHYPRWLNMSNPRVRIIPQDDLLPKKHTHYHRHANRAPLALEENQGIATDQADLGLDPAYIEDQEDLEEHERMPLEPPPTFNTNIIEQFLWRIPGLTENFIHMNDDYFYGGPWDPEDFFTPEGGTRFFYTRNRIPSDGKRTADLVSRRKIWLASLYNTMFAISKRYPSHASECYSLKHAPYVYSRDAWAWAHKIFRTECKNTMVHPFRHYYDILPPYLHHAFVMFEGSTWENPSPGEDGVVDNLDGWSHGEMEYPLIHKKYPYAFARNPNAWDDRGNELAFCILTDDYNAAKRCLDGWRRKLPTEQQQSKLWEFFLGSSGTPRFFVINDAYSKSSVGQLMRDFLEETLPLPSSFELTPDEAEKQYAEIKAKEQAK